LYTPPFLVHAAVVHFLKTIDLDASRARTAAILNLEEFPMSKAQTKTVDHTPLAVLTLAMALGPLTALSVGSRYADDATMARANAANPTYEVSAAPVAAPAAAAVRSSGDALSVVSLLEDTVGSDS
jgi:hypothetical protein